METVIQKNMGLRILLGTAAFIIIVAGLQAASELVTPFLLAVFITIICAPPMSWLQHKGLPNILALTVTIGLVAVFVLLITTLLQGSLSGFTEQLPHYQKQLQEKLDASLLWLSSQGVNMSRELVLDSFDPNAAMRLAKNTLTNFGSALSNIFLILLTVMFILAEASTFPRKLREVSREPVAANQQAEKIINQINRYMAIKALTSAVTGLLVWLLLVVLGVDFPILWGLLAFLFNFVPTIGSIIAAVPAVLMAFIIGDISDVILVATGYIVINTVIGNLLEPLFMGRNLGLSALVIFLSLVFWGWVLGPVGMLLSVPLTMTLKIAMENNPDTRHWAVLLGPAG